MPVLGGRAGLYFFDSDENRVAHRAYGDSGSQLLLDRFLALNDVGCQQQLGEVAFVEERAVERQKSVKRVVPPRASRMISNVHLSPRTSSERATGQLDRPRPRRNSARKWR